MVSGPSFADDISPTVDASKIEAAAAARGAYDDQLRGDTASEALHKSYESARADDLKAQLQADVLQSQLDRFGAIQKSQFQPMEVSRQQNAVSPLETPRQHNPVQLLPVQLVGVVAGGMGSAVVLSLGGTVNPRAYVANERLADGTLVQAVGLAGADLVRPDGSLLRLRVQQPGGVKLERVP